MEHPPPISTSHGRDANIQQIPGRDGVKAMASKLARPRESSSRRRSGRTAILWTLIVVFVAFGYFMWRAYRPVPVDVAIVSYQRAGAAAHPVLRQSGYVTYPRVITVGSASPGIVRAIYFEEGDVVARGDILVTFEVDELLAQKNIQEAARLDAERTLARVRNLHAAGAASDIDLQQAETGLASASAQLDLLDVRIESARIRAPFSGRILERLVDVGERAPAGICVLVDDSKTLVEIEINQDDLRRVKPQQPALIVLDAYPEIEYAGRLFRLGAIANRTTNTVKAEIEVSLPDSSILPNMSALVYLVDEQREENERVRSVLALDRTAIFDEAPGAYVWLVEEGKVYQRNVETGASLGEDFIEILDGLEADQVVVKRPSGSELREGQRVRVDQ